jgi:hypothetical protein
VCRGGSSGDSNLEASSLEEGGGRAWGQTQSDASTVLDDGELLFHLAVIINKLLGCTSRWAVHTARKLGPEQGTSAIDHALGNEEFPCVGNSEYVCLSAVRAGRKPTSILSAGTRGAGRGRHAISIGLREACSWFFFPHHCHHTSNVLKWP